MRSLSNFGAALVIAVMVASGMVMFQSTVSAQGPGRGNSGTTLCRLLAQAEETANALPDSDFKTAWLATINEQQAALNCGE